MPSIIWNVTERSLFISVLGRSHFRHVKLLIDNQIISKLNRFARSRDRQFPEADRHSPQKTNTNALQLSHHPASTNLLTPCFAIT
ncbi:hypothetical protein QUB60_28825 [Microcoleus sp. A2-C5]|uniref:hypothetical protein n=1 Tax=unclassified Microcoleus TaxID=2642155 RepID=UPI002FCFE76E